MSTPTPKVATLGAEVTTLGVGVATSGAGVATLGAGVGIFFPYWCSEQPTSQMLSILPQQVQKNENLI